MKHLFWLLPCLIIIFTSCNPNDPTIPGQGPNDSKDDGGNEGPSTEVVKPKYVSHQYMTYTYMDETLSSVYPDGYSYEAIYKRKSDAKFIEQIETRQNGVSLTLSKYTADGNKDYILVTDPLNGTSRNDTTIWADEDRLLASVQIVGTTKIVFTRDKNDLSKILDEKCYIDNKLFYHDVWKHSGNVAYVRRDNYNYSTQELAGYALDTLTYEGSYGLKHAQYWYYDLQDKIISHTEYDYTFDSKGLTKSYEYKSYTYDDSGNSVLSNMQTGQYTWKDDLHCHIVNTNYTNGVKLNVLESDYVYIR